MYVFVSALSLKHFQFLNTKNTVQVCVLKELYGISVLKILNKTDYNNFCFLKRWSPSLRIAGEGGQLAEFIDGLGPGQLVGRQVLGAPALGDIQLTFVHRKGFLEVEVVRARDLQARPNSKVVPGITLFFFILRKYTDFDYCCCSTVR